MHVIEIRIQDSEKLSEILPRILPTSLEQTDHW
jgi:hypothetical protein